MSARIVELPSLLCPNGQLAIAALIQRDVVSTASARLFVAKNYALFGTPPDSYSLLQTYRKFAWHGVLQASYPNTTLCVDTGAGANIQLDGPDILLPEVSDSDAVGAAYLVFIDDEILALRQPLLNAPGQYQISMVRGLFGTPIQYHFAGADVFIVPALDLLPIPLQFQPGNIAQFKLTLGVQQLADQEPFEVTFAGNAWNLPPPYFLKVNGINALGQALAPSDPVNVSWILPDVGAVIPRANFVKPSTLLQFVIGGNIVYSTTIAWLATTISIPWATITGGAQVPFWINARTQIDSGDSVNLGPSLCALPAPPTGLTFTSIAPNTAHTGEGLPAFTITGTGFLASGINALILTFYGSGYGYAIGAGLGSFQIISDVEIQTAFNDGPTFDCLLTLSYSTDNMATWVATGLTVNSSTP